MPHTEYLRKDLYNVVKKFKNKHNIKGISKLKALHLYNLIIKHKMGLPNKKQKIKYRVIMGKRRRVSMESKKLHKKESKTFYPIKKGTFNDKYYRTFNDKYYSEYRIYHPIKKSINKRIIKRTSNDENYQNKKFFKFSGLGIRQSIYADIHYSSENNKEIQDKVKKALSWVLEYYPKDHEIYEVAIKYINKKRK